MGRNVHDLRRDGLSEIHVRRKFVKYLGKCFRRMIKETRAIYANIKYTTC